MNDEKAPLGLQLGRDVNGNKTIKVRLQSTGNGFSVQTLGNMPQTHRMTKDNFIYKVAIAELEEHVSRYGTLRQRDVTGFTSEKLLAKRSV